MSTDELFASLGGSLMKDLWADLEVDGDDGIGFSLEQLERELSHLDDGSSSDNNATKPQGAEASNMLENTFAPPQGGLTMSVASRIVEHQNSALLPTPPPSSSKIAPPATADAWQESLKNFTSMGDLEQDFLAADSAKKVPKPPPGFMEQAEDYSLAKGPVVATPVVATPMSPPGIVVPVIAPGMAPPVNSPPPGMGEARVAPPPGLVVQSATVLPPGIALPPGMESVAMANEVDNRSKVPPTAKTIDTSDFSLLSQRDPPNKVPDNVIDEEKEVDAKVELKIKLPLFPETKPKASGLEMQNSIEIKAGQPMPKEKPAHVEQKQSSASTSSPVSTPQEPTLTPHRIPQKQPNGLSSPLMMQIPHVKPQIPPPGVMPGMPVGIPVPQMMKPGAPWQGPPKTLVQAQPVRIFCQVHPAAPPIPSAALESKYMPGRDLAYVLHSMLKPVLLRDVSEWDYDVQLLRRRTLGTTQQPHQSEQNQSSKSEEKVPENVTESRAKKTMEWMKKENTLGHVTKTDVTRPRALLATPKLSSVSSNEDQAQRASLWKARLYVDQGQAAATSLMEVWRSAHPGTIPPEVQPHLLKLFKVLGLKTQKDGIYALDTTKNNLACILKLSKGRTFMSRLFENALLPPNAVQALLPSALHHVCRSLPTSDDNMTDDRLFVSISRVIVNLNSLSPETLHSCLKAVSVKEALSSQSRMECVHAILRIGNANPTNEWKAAEAEFMKLLG